MSKIKNLLKKIFHKKDKNFVSRTDRFIMDFDQKHPKKSPSQQAEIKKYKRIFQLRDNVEKREKKARIWESF